MKLIQKKFMNEEGDKLRDRQRVKDKKLKQKLKIRALKAGKNQGMVAELGTPDEDDEEEYSDYEEGDDNEEQIDEEEEEYNDEEEY